MPRLGDLKLGIAEPIPPRFKGSCPSIPVGNLPWPFSAGCVPAGGRSRATKRVRHAAAPLRSENETMSASDETGAPEPQAAGEAYRLLFEHSPEMVCMLDLEGRFTSINPAGERLTGYAAADLVGRLGRGGDRTGVSRTGGAPVPGTASRRRGTRRHGADDTRRPAGAGHRNVDPHPRTATVPSACSA